MRDAARIATSTSPARAGLWKPLTGSRKSFTSHCAARFAPVLSCQKVRRAIRPEELATMLTPHEFSTLLLVANAPQHVDCFSPDFDALVAQAYVELVSDAPGEAPHPALTPQGCGVLARIGVDTSRNASPLAQGADREVRRLAARSAARQCETFSRRSPVFASESRFV
ncbi:hypothetical protein [Burkholderia stagnalis]|uniref:hypothetical protein n=2 Tax=Burkholderia stagnalis TaxID=1503054 RepID=UPI001E6561A4|nr:hypothetical protein [Burkholderia stagnalis]